MWCSVSIIIVLGYVSAQELTEDQYSSKLGHLKEIPRRFEVRGKQSNLFTKYVNDIQKIADANNFTVLYKVKVDLAKPQNKKHLKKITFKSKKVKSKKYNVPLKKQSMKLSNFEIMLRKIAEENGVRGRMRKVDEHEHFTTENVLLPQFYNSKQFKFLKFKPEVSRIKINYTKIVKPVKNKVITLTSKIE